MHHLNNGERVEADDGYIGEAPQYIKCPAFFVNPEETEYMQQRIRSRQETINNRVKMWGILANKYRHDLNKHSSVLRAVLVVTQIEINLGEMLFPCGYKDPPYSNNTANRNNTGWQRNDNSTNSTLASIDLY